MLIIIIILLVVILLFSLHHNYQQGKKHNQEIELFEEILDSIIYNNFDNKLVKYQEGQQAKLIFKARRVADITITKEKKIIKGHLQVQETIADISHQMRTPLASVLMYAELLRDSTLTSQETEEFSQRIVDSSNKLTWLGAEFINISRFETNSIELNLVEKDLNETIIEVVKLNNKQAHLKKITINFEKTDKNILAHDPLWTSEALSNILENAIKYANSSTNVTVRVERLLAYTRIDIVNYGMGLELNEQRLIYEKYYRGNNAQKHPGAGIGLYLSRLIVEQQGGYIIGSSNNNETKFSLFLLN